MEVVLLVLVISIGYGIILYEIRGTGLISNKLFRIAV